MVTRRQSRAGRWLGTATGLIVLLACCPISAEAALKTCKLQATVPAAPTPEAAATALKFYVALSEVGTGTAQAITTDLVLMPVFLHALGMEVDGTTYYVAASVVNAGGEGPRSAIVPVPINGQTGTTPQIAPLGPPTLSVVCP